MQVQKMKEQLLNRLALQQNNFTNTEWGGSVLDLCYEMLQRSETGCWSQLHPLSNSRSGRAALGKFSFGWVEVKNHC
jgi:hypothetical protein